MLVSSDALEEGGASLVESLDLEQVGASPKLARRLGEVRQQLDASASHELLAKKTAKTELRNSKCKDMKFPKVFDMATIHRPISNQLLLHRSIHFQYNQVHARCKF